MLIHKTYLFKKSRVDNEWKYAFILSTTFKKNHTPHPPKKTPKQTPQPYWEMAELNYPCDLTSFPLGFHVMTTLLNYVAIHPTAAVRILPHLAHRAQDGCQMNINSVICFLSCLVWADKSQTLTSKVESLSCSLSFTWWF